MRSFMIIVVTIITIFSTDNYALSQALKPEYFYCIGGSDVDRGFSLCVDSSNQAYITGYTISSDFPVNNAYQTNWTGVTEAFVVKLNSSGSGVIYSTYLGGSGDDRGYSIAVDTLGQAFITGRTSSTDFPIINAYQASCSGFNDVFVAKFTQDGSALLFSTYLGGNLGACPSNTFSTDYPMLYSSQS